MTKKRAEEDRRLRRLLRRGDPAGGDSPPAAQDLGRMRRQILEQGGADEPLSPRLGLRWVAVGVCVLILVVVGWQLRGPKVGPTVAPRIAEAQADSLPPAPVADVREVPAVPEEAEIIEVVVDEPPVVVAASDEKLQARTLHFTTQRGTQIIWIIDPELEL